MVIHGHTIYRYRYQHWVPASTVTVENLPKINGLKIKDPQSCGPKNHKIKTLGPANQHFHSNLVIKSDPDVHLTPY